MSDLGRMFNPSSIALIGATEAEGTVGRRILENLLSSGQRKVFPVNPNRKEVLGIPCYTSMRDVPVHVDLAIIAVPLDALVSVTEECARSQAGGVVITSSLGGKSNRMDDSLERTLLGIRREYGMRILGPECLGFIRPHIGLNTTPVAGIPDKGEIALITQSVAFGKSLFDWGISSNVGFSMFASLGVAMDVGFGDIIDYLGTDPHTRSIMIYMEKNLGDVKKFFGAARAYARNKPIVILKPQEFSGQKQDAMSHTSVLAGPEEVYDAVFRRLGVVRVWEVKDLFNTAAVLYSKQLPKGPRLAIIANAGGAATMAANRLVRSGGQLAVLSPETVDRLDDVLPGRWNRRNPIDIFRTAGVEQYMEAVRIALDSPDVDGILVVYTPLNGALPEELARALGPVAKGAHKPIITTWLGGKNVLAGREILAGYNIPAYDTPEDAVRTYIYMYSYERNLQLLYETPSELPLNEAPPKNHLKNMIRKACKEAVPILTEEESRKFLVNYGIPTLETKTASSAEEAIRYARDIGYPVVLKIASPDIIYRQDVGGVIMDVNSDDVLTAEYEKILKRVRQYAPDAEIRGVSIQKMIEVIDYELILGARKDQLFGSIILFGMGGIGVQLYRDFAIGLPPLNQALARRIIEDTGVYKMLQGYRGKSPADLRQLEQIIVSFSNMIVDFPEIFEMDINPIAVSNGKAFALGSRIILDSACRDIGGSYTHLVITPYPTRYMSPWRLADGTEILLRPIRPEDEPLEHEMFMTLSEESLRGRYYQSVRNISHMMHVRSCNIDYDREMAIVAELRENGKRRLIGIGSFEIEPDFKKCEFAIMVHDAFQGKGLAYKLLDVLIGIAREKRLEEFYGYIEQQNKKMIQLCEKLGMIREADDDDDELFKVRLFLH
jgi:acetyltransferase